MKILASHPSSCVTSWQSYDINGYTYYTHKKDKRSVVQNSGIRIEAFNSLGVKTTYYVYIQDIWELDYDARLQILIFKCEWGQTPEWCERGQLWTDTNWLEKCRSQRWSMSDCRPCRTSFLCTRSRNWETRSCFWKVKNWSICLKRCHYSPI
jgi:hypothetical protein